MSHSIEKGDQIFGGQVAARPRAIGTPSETGGGGIEFTNAFVETCESISKRASVGIVKMKGQIIRRNLQFFFYECQRFGDLNRKPHAVCIANGHAPRTYFASCANDFQ